MVNYIFNLKYYLLMINILILNVNVKIIFLYKNNISYYLK